MISPAVIFGVFVTLAGGACFARALAPRASLLTTSCLGLAVGISLASCAHYLWQETVADTPVPFVVGDLLFLAAGVGALAWRCSFHPGKRTDRAGGAAAPASRGPRLLIGVLVAVTLVVAITDADLFVLQQQTGSVAQSDALTMWNLKARFLVRANGAWATVLGPPFSYTHPDYPLLLPLTIARVWRYAGSDAAVCSSAVAGAFAAGVVLLLGAGVRELRGSAQGTLAALALLSVPYFFDVGAFQYADVPLALFELASFVAAALAFRGECCGDAATGWVLAGMCAGAAAWTKNEGQLFAGLFALSVALVSILRGEAMRAPGRLVALALGALPALLALVAFRLQHPASNDLVNGLSPATVGGVLEPARHARVLRLLFDRARESRDLVPLLLVIGYGAVVLRSSRRADRGGASPAPVNDSTGSDCAAAAVSMLCVALTSAGFYGAYLVTPYDVSWHVANSAGRLAIQLLPGLLFAIFLLLPPLEPGMRGKVE